jgi:hypothetical protein
MASDASIIYDSVPTITTLPLTNDQNAVLTFNITGTHDTFINLRSLCLSIDAEGLDDNGDHIPIQEPARVVFETAAKVAKTTDATTAAPPAPTMTKTEWTNSIPIPSQAFLFTMFKELEIEFNNTRVFTTQDLYRWHTWADYTHDISPVTWDNHLETAGFAN